MRAKRKIGFLDEKGKGSAGEQEVKDERLELVNSGSLPMRYNVDRINQSIGIAQLVIR
jgi:hypothetical protein